MDREVIWGRLVDDVRTYYINAESKERELLKALIMRAEASPSQAAFA